MATKSKWNVKRLTRGRFRVTGTDVDGVTDVTVLVSPAWEGVLDLRTQGKAEEIFAEGVQEAFAPVLKAIKKANRVLDRGHDYSTYVVTEGSEGEDGIAIPLDEEGEILYMLESGKGDSLVWVKGELFPVH